MVTPRRTWYVHFDTDAEELLQGETLQALDQSLPDGCYQRLH
jgi:hypothetical protein